MKFCVITDRATPLVACTGGLLLGGSTTFLLNLGRAFSDRDLSLPVVCIGGPNQMAADFDQAKIDVSGWPDPKLIFEDRLAAVYRRIAEKQPQAVLASLGGDSFEMTRMAPQNAVRLGIIQSDDAGPYQLVRDFSPWLDAAIGVSEKICERVAQEPFAKKLRIEHIPYGVYFGPARVVPPRDSARPLRLIYVGRIIEEQKRVSRFAELAKLLSARGEKFEFTLIGSGPQLQSCRESLSAFPNVKFLGDVPNQEIKKHLRESDVFLLLSDYEGLPLSLLEAMGEGVVPVVSDLESGMRQVVTPETGVRVPIGDVNAAAEAISSLGRDTARCASLANAAAEHVRQHYSAGLMAERYLKLISELEKGKAVWPSEVSVPVPLGYGKNFLTQKWSRPIRRLIKRVVR